MAAYEEQFIRLCKRAFLYNIPILISGEYGSGRHWLASRIATDFKQEQIRNWYGDQWQPDSTEKLIRFFTENSKDQKQQQRLLILHNISFAKNFFAEVPIKFLLEKYKDGKFHISDNTNVSCSLITITADDIGTLQQNGELNYFYYNTLVGLSLEIPPLRKRRSEILELAEEFRKELDDNEESFPAGFSPDVEKALKSYHWPGNIAELRQVMRHAIVMSTSGFIELKDLPQHIINPKRKARTFEALPEKFDLNDEIRQITQGYIERALREAGGKKSIAAKKLGLKSQQALDSKMKATGMKQL